MAEDHAGHHAGHGAGQMIRWIVCHLLAPAVRASRMEPGTAARASSVATMTTGSVRSSKSHGGPEDAAPPNVAWGDWRRKKPWKKGFFQQEQAHDDQEPRPEGCPGPVRELG